MGVDFNLFLTEPAFSAASVSQYFIDSNFAGQVIVVLLAIFSLVAWAVMLGKYFDLVEIKKLNAFTEKKLSGSSTIFNAVATQKGLKGSYAVMVAEAVNAWSRADASDFSMEMQSVRMGHVENAIQRVVAHQTLKYESKMVLLGSIISGAPFLGLLGTVWGVMDAFGALSTQTSATLQSLAPGVSGALLTTVAGLIVAIPSVFGYNFLLTLSRGMVLDLENFAGNLADRIELETRKSASAENKETYKPLSENSNANLEAKKPQTENKNILLFDPEEEENS